MILFYTSPGCASCRKARQVAPGQPHRLCGKEHFSNLLQDAEIRYLMTRCENGTEDIISTRSKAYSQIRDALEDLSMAELTTFIQQNPSVLKRPILLSEKSMVVGFDGDEITAVVPPAMRRERMALQSEGSAPALVQL